MKLNYITLAVRDMEKSIAFYRELAGLHVLRRFNPGMGEIAFLANAEGETMLELAQFDGHEKVTATGMVISFLACGGLAELRARAVELGYNPSDIMTIGPKPEYFTVSDPDGIVIEFSI